MATAQPDIFQRAHLDAQTAVKTFLPSLSGQPQAPPPKPHPLAKYDPVQDMVHAASMARHVEQASSAMAQGKPANPNPPPPEQAFGNVLDVVHTQALRSAIAAHPEVERSRLISEVHDSTAKWIMSHRGKVVVHGKVMVARSPEQAETLAAKIVNDEVEGHDQDQADQAHLDADQSAQSQGSRSRKGRQSNSAASRPDQGGNRSGSEPVSGAPNGNASAIGSVDPATGRTITHSTDDLDQAQEIATAAAPDLEDKLQDVADKVPGIKVHGVRPVKDKDRAERKEESDDKPINTHSDLLAGRLIADSPEAKDAAVDALKTSTPVIDEEDSFQHGDPDYSFRSHDLQVALDSDKGPTSAEVQIVPKEVAEVDEETHPTYEAGRDAEADGDTATAEKAKADNRAVHDAAMDKFNERNAGDDKNAKLRQLLKEAGFDVAGDPVSIGGHSFLPIREQEENQG